MTIRFNKDTIGVWFVEFPDSDWLASIWMEDGKPTLTYRFRHYEDDKVWDSEDRKNWYELKTDDVHKLIETTRVLAREMSAAAGSEPYEIMASDFTDIDAFMEEFQKAPFVSMKKETVQ